MMISTADANCYELDSNCYAVYIFEYEPGFVEDNRVSVFSFPPLEPQVHPVVIESSAGMSLSLTQ